jgi:hypothetical protein
VARPCENHFVKRDLPVQSNYSATLDPVAQVEEGRQYEAALPNHFDKRCTYWLRLVAP